MAQTYTLVPMIGACDVCVLLDQDSSPKEVTYCGICGAHMCDPCWNDMVRRSLAFVRRMFGGGQKVKIPSRPTAA